MTLEQAEQIANQMLREHKLYAWKFKWMRADATRMRGWCAWTKKTISLSRNYVLTSSHDDIIDTIKHEIAHALTPPATLKSASPNRCHGVDWQRKCVELGIDMQKHWFNRGYQNLIEEDDGEKEYNCTVELKVEFEFTVKATSRKKAQKIVKQMQPKLSLVGGNVKKKCSVEKREDWVFAKKNKN